MRSKLKNIDVLILCGGLGKRLKKISGNKPKPMVEISGRPFLDILIENLANKGFRNFILGLGYKAGVIKDYYNPDNKEFSFLNIAFSVENKPLGTGGAVKNAKSAIKSGLFFVVNGDTFCDFNAEFLIDFHKKRKSLATILLKKISDGREFGEVIVDNSWRINDFKEKNNNSKNCLVNAGVYCFDVKVFDLMPLRKTFSLEYDFFPSIINKNIYGYPTEKFFIDLGTPKRYLKAKRYFLGS